MTDLTASPLGKSFRFRVVALNQGGKSITSRSLRVTIAAPPTTPITAPQPDATTTNGAVIRIVYAAPTDGGSPITNYEIQMDDGIGGGFITIAGGSLGIHLYTFF